MKNITVAIIVTVLMVSFADAGGQVTPSVNDMDATVSLKSFFANPPSSARPLTWWHWMNGHVSKTGIERDLQTMKDVCIKGFVLFETGHLPKGNVRFNSELYAI
jgi:hypothetical protein